MKTITITILLTDSEFKVIDRAAKEQDLEADAYLAQPVCDKVFEMLEDTDSVSYKSK